MVAWYGVPGTLDLTENMLAPVRSTAMLRDLLAGSGGTLTTILNKPPGFTLAELPGVLPVVDTTRTRCTNLAPARLGPVFVACVELVVLVDLDAPPQPAIAKATAIPTTATAQARPGRHLDGAGHMRAAE